MKHYISLFYSNRLLTSNCIFRQFKKKSREKFYIECTRFFISVICMVLYPEEAQSCCRIHLSDLQSCRRLAERETYLPESRCLNHMRALIYDLEVFLALPLFARTKYNVLHSGYSLQDNKKVSCT